jgi:hypothetical protein
MVSLSFSINILYYYGAFVKTKKLPGVMVHSCNPSREAEAGKLKVRGQPGLYSGSLSKITTNQKQQQKTPRN